MHLYLFIFFGGGKYCIKKRLSAAGCSFLELDNCYAVSLTLDFGCMCTPRVNVSPLGCRALLHVLLNIMHMLHKYFNLCSLWFIMTPTFPWIDAVLWVSLCYLSNLDLFDKGSCGVSIPVGDCEVWRLFLFAQSRFPRLHQREWDTYLTLSLTNYNVLFLVYLGMWLHEIFILRKVFCVKFVLLYKCILFSISNKQKWII